jgi:sugar lactone lactonase YvrE
MGRLVIRGDYLYFTDTMNSVVRRINLSTTIIETIAGTAGVYGFAGDGGPATAAELFLPCDVDVDDEGNVYIADTFNSRIRRVTTDGNIETLVGNGVAPTSTTPPVDVRDGVATEAWLDRPYGIALDADQKLYIADTHNHRIRGVY